MIAVAFSLLALGASLASLSLSVWGWRRWGTEPRAEQARLRLRSKQHNARLRQLEQERHGLVAQVRVLEELLGSLEARLVDRGHQAGHPVVPSAQSPASAPEGGRRAPQIVPVVEELRVDTAWPEPVEMLAGAASFGDRRRLADTPLPRLADTPLPKRADTPPRAARVLADTEAPVAQGMCADSGDLLVPVERRAPECETGLVPGSVVLRRFRIQHEIGRGGMGTVYLAHDQQLGDWVALKVLSGPFGSGSRAAAERFRREARAAHRITHPNVIRIYDLFEEGSQLFLSMEYAPGPNLSELLVRGGALPMDEALDLLCQICDGLAAAHRAGIVHRDLKPENVLVLGHGIERRAKLIDFGLARAPFLRCLTETGLIMGTPEYMAPEQVRGAPVDARSDLYSLGCLAYHMLTGDPPFVAETPLALAFRHCTDAPRSPRAVRPELDPAIEAMILRALAKDPQARFASAEEMKQAVLDAVESSRLLAA